MFIIASNQEILKLLQENTSIAVLGSHENKEKAACYVPSYLKENDYKIYPVNPKYVADKLELFGQKVVANLTDLEQKIDIVNIFRKSEDLEAPLEDILAMKHLPKLVWLQLGIKNNEIAKRLSEQGIDVVQDKCMLAKHKRLIAKTS